MAKGFFVTFEGGEGAGKTTQINMLRDALAARNVPALFVREPGGTKAGQQIRSILLDKESSLSPISEVFLFNAARRQLVSEVILPALAAGKLVVCDRYVDSTIAYQHFGRGVPLDVVVSISDIGSYGLVPDLTIYLDIDPVSGLKRKSDNEVTRMELAGVEFHRKVRSGYLKMASTGDSRRWVVVDASISASDIHSSLLPVILDRSLGRI